MGRFVVNLRIAVVEHSGGGLQEVVGVDVLGHHSPRREWLCARGVVGRLHARVNEL
jgi:hypothetical protein